MREHPSPIDRIFFAQWLTVQEFEELDQLEPSQNTKFQELMQLLLDSRLTSQFSLSNNIKRNVRVGKRIPPFKLVFRGDNFDNCAGKLFDKSLDVNDSTLFAKLFFFGEKAKHYYRISEANFDKRRWISAIEDHSIDSAKMIFRKIRAILKKRSEVVESFRISNLEFTKFFSNNANLEHFAQQLVQFRILRDYYLYFLHTAGKIGIGDASLLVSTSMSYDVAQKFSGMDDERFIIYYLIPAPFEKFCVSPRSVRSYVSKGISDSIAKLAENAELPTYRGRNLYPDQFEVAIKGALFPHHMLGVMREKADGASDFVINPHIFRVDNSIEAIFKGLKIDQSQFEEDLNITGYTRGVELGWNAEYSTIKRKLTID